MYIVYTQFCRMRHFIFVQIGETSVRKIIIGICVTDAAMKQKVNKQICQKCKQTASRHRPRAKFLRPSILIRGSMCCSLQ